MRQSPLVLGLPLLTLVLAGPAGAHTPLAVLRVAPDIALALGGTAYADHQVLEDDLEGTTLLVDLGRFRSAPRSMLSIASARGTSSSRSRQ